MEWFKRKKVEYPVQELAQKFLEEGTWDRGSWIDLKLSNGVMVCVSVYHGYVITPGGKDLFYWLSKTDKKYLKDTLWGHVKKLKKEADQEARQKAGELLK